MYCAHRSMNLWIFVLPIKLFMNEKNKLDLKTPDKLMYCFVYIYMIGKNPWKKGYVHDILSSVRDTMLIESIHTIECNCQTPIILIIDMSLTFLKLCKSYDPWLF